MNFDFMSYDKSITNEDDLYALYANQEMGKTGKLELGQESASPDKTTKELSYTKKYTGLERVGRFFEGLVLTVGTLCTGLTDQRVRHKFAAAFDGEVVKKVLVTNDVYSKVISGTEGTGVVNENMSAYELAFIAEKLLKDGHIETAKRALLTAQSKDAKNTFVLGLLGEVAIREAKGLTDINAKFVKLIEALELLNKVIEQDSKNVYAYAQLGSLYVEMATTSPIPKLSLDEAKKYFTKAIDLNPEAVFAREQLGIMLVNEKKYSEAYACFKEVRLKELSSEGFAAYANALKGREGGEQSVQGMYQAAKDREISDPSGASKMYVAIVNSLGNKLSPPLRLENLNKAIELNPNNDEAYLSKYYLYKGTNNNDAINALDKAIKINPNNMEALQIKLSHIAAYSEKTQYLQGIIGDRKTSTNDAALALIGKMQINYTNTEAEGFLNLRRAKELNPNNKVATEALDQFSKTVVKK